MSEPAFKLFRATVPTPRGAPYIGSVRCPHCNRHSFVEARVIQEPGIARHFEGVLLPQATLDLRTAKRQRTQKQQDLVDPAPFDDPLPEA